MKFNDTNDDIIENHEINVTPFIDVMLVLLIIFMVTAPLSTVTVPIELPASNVTPIDASTPKPVIITISKEGEYILDKVTYHLENLMVKVKKEIAQQEVPLVYLQADKKTSYEELMILMNHIRNHGVTNIGLVAKPEKNKF